MKGRSHESVAALVPELLVSDHARGLAFYTAVLGFSEVYGRPEEGFSYLDREGAQLMIDQRSPGGVRDWVAGELGYLYGRGINLEIGASDVEVIHAACVADSAQIFLRMEEIWYRRGRELLGVKQFIVMDPDGYMLRFSQSIGVKRVEGA